MSSMPDPARFDNAEHAASTGGLHALPAEGRLPSHWEVEQKFPLGQFSSVETTLHTLEVRFSAPSCQADHYFNHPARDFFQTDEAFRLREDGEQNFITYKGPKVDQETKTRRELELPLPAGSDVIPRFRAILEALGFRYVATVRKTRRVGSLTWEGRRFELALDDVEGLGTFLELETVADDAGLPAARHALLSLAKRLNLKQAERRSYLELLLARPTA